MKKTNDGLYYKFRSAKQDKHLEDIFKKQRLFAATRNKLNDPMEGIYKLVESDKPSNTSSVSNINERKDIIDFVKAIKNVKNQYRICAFSRNKNTLLLWSHYADSCSGIAIGFKLEEVAEENQQFGTDVDYIDNIMRMNLEIKKNQGPEILAKDILSKKLKDWEYEDEARVLTKKNYVPIEIKSVVLGPNISRESTKYIRKLVEEYENAYNKTHKEEIKVQIFKESIYELQNINQRRIMD
ncbi:MULTISPECIES: DUF2971 domain-containing protein [Lactococcus]|uniref:DUF2971 domain-containing protein n=1 Tax=Lactococcus TaxID=1357 RepID=UPI000CE371AD|nr:MULTISPECIES: DUF2971 domain-containing protein [Lactococcus]MCD6633040.1 DUF2971 domain-containing protein [Lactococcus cremoris]PPA67861.1 hypothetical protein C3952_04055 [Lactococcus lactis]